MIIRRDTARALFRAWHVQEAQRIVAERALAKRADAIMRAWAEAAARAHDAGVGMEVVAVFYSGRMNTLMLTAWQIQAQAGAEKLRLELGLDIANQGLTRRTIEQYADKRTQTIVQNYRQQINDALAKTVAEGQGQAVGGKAIRELVDITRAQANRIARTETHAAYQAGSHAQAEDFADTGLPMLKIWMAGGDERTRPAHQEANGQTVPIDQPFVVDGEQLMHPGDPAGSAGNVINCRCAMGYRVDREALASRKRAATP